MSRLPLSKTINGAREESRALSFQDDYSEQIDETYGHFRLRLRQRYGMDISKIEYMDLCEQKMVFIPKRDKALRYALVNFKKALVLVMYDSHSKRIRTALPISKLIKLLK